MDAISRYGRLAMLAAAARNTITESAKPSRNEFDFGPWFLSRRASSLLSEFAVSVSARTIEMLLDYLSSVHKLSPRFPPKGYIGHYPSRGRTLKQNANGAAKAGMIVSR